MEAIGHVPIQTWNLKETLGSSEDGDVICCCLLLPREIPTRLSVH